MSSELGKALIVAGILLVAIGLLLTTLFGMEAGLIFSLVISVLAAYGLPNTLDLMPYYLLATLTGVFGEYLAKNDDFHSLTYVRAPFEDPGQRHGTLP